MGDRSGARQSYRAHMATRLLLHRLRERILEEETMQAAYPGGRGPQQISPSKDIHRTHPQAIFLERIGSTSSHAGQTSRSSGGRCRRAPQAGYVVI